MATRGRPPKPTLVKVLTGNPGNRPLNLNEPKPTGEPIPPSDLCDEARDLWARVVRSQALGLYTICDEELLASYCETVVLRRKLQAELRSMPAVISGSTGQTVANPLIDKLSGVIRLVVTLSAELGLSPRARQALEIKPDVEKKSKFGASLGRTRD